MSEADVKSAKETLFTNNRLLAKRLAIKAFYYAKHKNVYTLTKEDLILEAELILFNAIETLTLYIKEVVKLNSLLMLIVI